MKRSRYEGPFAEVIGTEDLLQPTQRRLLWLLVGLVAAAAFGFVAGLMQPRPLKTPQDQDS